MLIAHVSDFHVFAEKPTSSLVRVDAEHAARLVLDDIRRFTPQIDMIMLTGDLADEGSGADYDLIHSMIDDLGIPVFPVLGNHDNRQNFRAAFSGLLPFSDGDYLNYETQSGGIRILALDSVIEGKIKGALAPQSLDWLQERLTEPFEGITYLLIHHPPPSSGVGAWDAMSLTQGSDRFSQLVGDFAGPLYILCGHVHRPFQTQCGGKPVLIGGSPGFQIGLDLTPGAPDPGAIEEPYYYFIHAINGNDVAVHRRFVDIQKSTKTG